MMCGALAGAIAGKPTPTKVHALVETGLPAIIVNDNARYLTPCVRLGSERQLEANQPQHHRQARAQQFVRHPA